MAPSRPTTAPAGRPRSAARCSTRKRWVSRRPVNSTIRSRASLPLQLQSERISCSRRWYLEKSAGPMAASRGSRSCRAASSAGAGVVAAASRFSRLRTVSSAAIGLESRLLARVVLNSWPALALASLSGSLRSLSRANTRSSFSLAGHSTSAVSRSLTLLRRSAITSLRKRRTYRSLMSSLVYLLGSAMAVGSSMFIRLAKLSGLPSCGVADSRISVSERVASRSASRARWLFWAPRARSATFWHSSITMMSQLALSR